MADGGSGFKPIVNEVSSYVVKPLTEEAQRAAETATSAVLGVKINPQTQRPADNSQNKPNLSSEEQSQKRQEEKKQIDALRWKMNKAAELDAEMLKIREEKKKEEEEKKRAEFAKKQEEQAEEMQKQEESKSLNPQVQAEMIKTEAGKGKGVGG